MFVEVCVVIYQYVSLFMVVHIQLSILRTSPDIIPEYLQSIQRSAEIRVSDKWFVLAAIPSLHLCIVTFSRRCFFSLGSIF